MSRVSTEWYREVTRDQWMAFIGSYAGWVLDGFDYTTLTFQVGNLQDRGLPLPTAIVVCIAASGLTLMLLIALGPETRGKDFSREP